MSVLNRETILQKTDLKTEKVEVPEWGGDVYVREFTQAERTEFEVESYLEEDKKKTDSLKTMKIKTVIMSTVDDKGNNLFTIKDFDVLNRKSACVIDRIWSEAWKLSGMQTGDIEKATKN